MHRKVHLVLIGIFLVVAATSFAADELKNSSPRFDILAYQVDGRSLLTIQEIQAILAPYTGNGKGFGTVQEAREALEKAYRKRGFKAIQVIIPEQTLEKGLVRLRVIEATIGKIETKGNAFYDEKNIRNSLPSLKPGKPLNISALSENLKIANESPAKKTNLQMKSGDKDNEVDVTVQVRDEKPWKVGLTLDNSGEERTGSWRLGALWQHANVFNLDHLLSLQYITSPTKLDQVRIYGLGYRVPIYPLGATLDLVGAYSDVDSGSLNLSSTTMQVSGKGTTLGLHYNQQLSPLGNYEHKLIAGLDYRAYTNNVNWLGNQLGNDVTVHPISLTYAGTFTENKLGGGFSLGIFRNLPGGWAGKDGDDDFQKVRSGARSDYTLFRLGANMLFPFLNDWQARAIVNAQYTNDSLVPGEQFGLGGANSVRGFGLRVATNDKGYSGSVEIQTPNLASLVGLKSAQCRGLVFYDRGEVSRVNPLPGEISNSTLSSFGLGLRISDGKYYTISTDYGFIIDPLDSGKPGGGLWHILVSVLY